tara:strand:+ start:479 stop:934 length:456 start_codon:yes stop_codon:yes gene_type:complete
MANRTRTYTEGQTHFSKEFYKMGGEYMTDIDGLQLVDTENQIYNHFNYVKGQPVVKKFIEVKYDFTEDIKRQVRRIDKPRPQTYAIASVVSEMNGYRKDQNKPLADFYYVVQTKGNYPYYIFNVTIKEAIVTYEYKCLVENFDEYHREMKK